LAGDDEEIRDGGWTTLSQGEGDDLRLTIFADEETYIWTDIDDTEVDSLIRQLQEWRQFRRFGRRHDA
jgi:hypothetical protein